MGAHVTKMREPCAAPFGGAPLALAIIAMRTRRAPQVRPVRLAVAPGRLAWGGGRGSRPGGAEPPDGSQAAPRRFAARLLNPFAAAPARTADGMTRPHASLTRGRLLASAPLLAAAFAACSSPAASPIDTPQTPVAVHAQPARVATLVVGEEIVGTVRARDTAEIAPTVMGAITELRCTLGSEVKAGQPIARIAVRELAARLTSARAALAQAELERGRTTRLLAGGAITGAERDAAETRHQIATAGVAEALAMADHAIVRAPFSGVVTAKLASAGDVAMPGRPLCAIQDPGALRFEAIVPETLAGAFAKVRAVPVLIASLDAPLTATVVEVAPAADPVSRTVLVKLALPADPRVRAGAFGRATVPAREMRAVTAPSGAIVRHGELEAVFVVAGATARMRLVKTGRTIDGQVELLAGLAEGEVVITDPGALVDGQPVAVRP